MADNQEKSDDLIAELAKLMASNAQGTETEPKPSVIKLTPLSEARPASSYPVRIPGMDAPSSPSAPTAPPAGGVVRIPGMAQPAPASMPVREPVQSPRAVPEAPPAAVVGTTVDNAQKAAPQPASPEPTPTAERPPVSFTPAPAPRPAPPAEAAEPEPTAADSVRADESESEPNAGTDDGFDFDFGFGATAEDDKSAAEEEAEAATQRDPIADLIAAELGASQAPPPASDDADKPVAAPAFRQPASVEAVPGRSFGSAVQAPVLIARPVGTGAAQPSGGASASPLPGGSPASQHVPPTQPAGGDKFAVAPVFGLGGGAPTAPARRSAGDPMDEIENLIGEAVRVQLSSDEDIRQPEERQQPAPVVPPLNTGFAPRRAGLKDVDQRAQSAEAAILAAAAATGAEVGRINAPAAEERPYRRTAAVKPPNTRLSSNVRQYLGIGVAALLLLAAGFGLYWVLGMGRGDPATAPVLSADTTPVKEAPAAPAVATAEAPRSVVFDEIDGVDTADGSETLVSRDETAGASPVEVARIVEPETSEAGLANRKVRTVTVRPDGTIVSGDEAVAGTEALPVERPNVPELPGAAAQPSELLTAAAADTPDSTASVGGDSAAGDEIAALVDGTTATTEPVPTELAALTTEAETPAVFDGGLVAPRPMPRPADRSALTGSQGASGAATAREPASLPLVSLNESQPAAPAAPAPTSANAYVQLASLPSEAEARSQLAASQSRWGNLFGGQSLVVQRAELGDGRVTYRVRLPASSLQGASQICASIKANGGDCFATNG